MKLTLKTLKLQEMVAKSIQGASNNKMIPITSLMAIQWKDGILTLTTTDAANTLKILDKLEGEDFYVVLQTEIFSKLIAKTTTETITLNLKENGLEVKGNGTYNIELPLDEEGKLIKFPEYKMDHAKAEKSTTTLPIIKTILTANKAAVANTMELPHFTGYYFDDDKVITTDTFKVCNNAVKVLPRKMLLPTDLVDLLSIIDEEKIDIEIVKNKILFITKNVIIYGTEMGGINDYPIDAIEAYSQTAFENMCRLPKLATLNMLDRLSLFISPYEKNSIYLTFSTDGLICSSKRSNGTELIKYQESTNFKPFACSLDIAVLKTLISSQDGEVIELWYGQDQVIKMIDGKITQIMALLEDDRAETDGSSES